MPPPPRFAWSPSPALRGRIIACLLALAFALLAIPARADPSGPAIDQSLGKVEVTLDLPKDKPYVGEMIMLRMRSFIRAFIVLDEIREPALVDFDVQQLGHDKPIEAMVDGFRVQGVERDVAIFPQQSGRLIIPPFVRHVTITDSNGNRTEGEFASKPIYVDVQNYQAINPPSAWWLPVKSLSLTDSWSPEPDEIAKGTLARRTVTIEAVGMTADRLPPAPEMRAPGIIAFRGPVERETTLTEDGPVAHAVYRWDLRPATGAPAKLDAIDIPWFDTGERRMRDAAIPERWVAYLGTFVHARLEKLPSFGELVTRPGPIAAGLAGFAWTALAVGFVLTRGPRDKRSRDRRRLLRRLARRARFNDDAGFRDAIAMIGRREPRRWRDVTSDRDIARRLAALDAARYGRSRAPLPALTPLAADIARAWQAADARIEAETRDRLPPLDGDMPREASWRDRLRPALAWWRR